LAAVFLLGVGNSVSGLKCSSEQHITGGSLRRSASARLTICTQVVAECRPECEVYAHVTPDEKHGPVIGDSGQQTHQHGGPRRRPYAASEGEVDNHVRRWPRAARCGLASGCDGRRQEVIAVLRIGSAIRNSTVQKRPSGPKGLDCAIQAVPARQA